MKFIQLKSRGGNYLVVAENVAWLRSAENGQTNVGIIGSQPLLVIGSIEEVAAQILAESAPDDQPLVDRSVAPPEPPEPVRDEVVESPAEAPALPEPVRDEVIESRTEAPSPMPAPVPERPRAVSRSSPTRREHSAPAAGPRVKAGTQRFMGKLE